MAAGPSARTSLHHSVNFEKVREMPHLTADLPSGWQGKKRTPLGPGDLAVLFRQAPYELSFNELGLQVLMDGIPLKSDDIDLAYVGLSEQGYKAKKGEATDAILKVAFERRSHPVRRYFESLRGRTDLRQSTSTCWLRSIWGFPQLM